MTRVLYVTYAVPWNSRYGGAIRCHGVLRGLAERTDLHVALASSEPGTREAFMVWSHRDSRLAPRTYLPRAYVLWTPCAAKVPHAPAYVRRRVAQL